MPWLCYRSCDADRDLALRRASPSRTPKQLVAACKARGEFIQGPQIAEFEAAFAGRHGLGPSHAITAAYGRIAFYYMLKALDLPPGSEIIFPSLTFWVVPELARVAGLTVVFADVDPKTFNIDPESVERLITDKTRAIVPTHLYGLPCDMDALLAIAARHNLIVLEDCAHALGATYKGRPVGTFGDRRAVQLSDAQAAQLLRRRAGARERSRRSPRRCARRSRRCRGRARSG